MTIAHKLATEVQYQQTTGNSGGTPNDLLTMTAETDSATMTARTTAINAALAAQTGDHKLARGLYQINGTALVPGPGILQGNSCYDTFLRGSIGGTFPIVANTDWEDMETDEDGQWAFEGRDIRPVVRDLGILGGRTALSHENNSNPHIWDTGESHQQYGIKFYCPGPRIERVRLHDISGTAIYLARGDSTLVGGRLALDSSKPLVTDVEGHNAQIGLHINGGSDGVVKGFYWGAARDQGVRIDGGGAWNLSDIHVYGIYANEAGEPDWGIGILCGASDGSSGQAYFGNNVQVDGCRIGIRNRVANSQYSQIIAKNCYETCLDVVRGCQVGQLRIDNMNNPVEAITTNGKAFVPTLRTAVNIGPLAKHFQLDLCDAALTDYSSIVALRVLGQNHTIQNMHCEGSSNSVGIVFGQTGTPGVGEVYAPSGCKMDITLRGFAKCLQIDAIGVGNDITIRHDGAATPIEDNTAGLSGNRIRAIDVSSGEEDVVQDWTLAP